MSMESFFSSRIRKNIYLAILDWCGSCYIYPLKMCYFVISSILSQGGKDRFWLEYFPRG